jgi:hypothetical protein
LTLEQLPEENLFGLDNDQGRLTHPDLPLAPTIGGGFALGIFFGGDSMGIINQQYDPSLLDDLVGDY